MRGLQEELRRTNIELLEILSLAAAGKMTTFISHDLRNHRSVICGNLELLTDDKACGRNGSDLVEEVRSAIRDMADMLDSLLLFAPTGQSLRPGLESLNQLIEHAVDLVRFYPAARNVEMV
jgi:signal transduction histidine kinase